MHKPFVITAGMVLIMFTAWAQPRTDSTWRYAATVNADETVEGEVTYKKSAVNYIPVKRVIYSVRGRKPDTAFFAVSSFQTIFAPGGSVAGKAPGDTSRRVLSATDDSVAEEAPTYPFIGIGFGDDPAVIPRGAWHVIRTKTGTDAAIVDYDDNGNAIRVRTFSEDGTLLKDEHFAPCGKRKMIQRDALGATQICPLEIPKN
jgi:hypothetical protein